MDAEKPSNQSNHVEDDYIIEWFSDVMYANDFMDAGNALEFPSGTPDTEDALPPRAEQQADFEEHRLQPAPAKNPLSLETSQLRQVVTADALASSSTGSFVDPGLHSLDELVDRLVHPDCDSIEMNNLGTAIVMHPDITKRTSKLNMYSKMNGGLKCYSPGTTQAWLYTPKKRKSPRDDDVDRTVPSKRNAALVVVYPDKPGSSGGTGSSKDVFHFGGRAHIFHSGSDFNVLIQHGAYGALGCVRV